MKARTSMCARCPFGPNPLQGSEDMMGDVMERIQGGERWICHATTDGPRVTERSQFCAGAPLP